MDLGGFWDGIQSALDSLGLDITSQQFLTCLGIGIAAGWIASQVVGGKGGIFRYLIAGLIGSLLGPVIISFADITLPVLGFPVVNDIMVSTIGAIVVVVVARIVG